MHFLISANPFKSVQVIVMYVKVMCKSFVVIWYSVLVISKSFLEKFQVFHKDDLQQEKSYQESASN